MEQAIGRDSLLARSAPWRLLDRPFTISEWNIPAPHDYAASVVPFAAVVAALQDWDGVFFFTYGNSSDWFGDRLSGYFSFNGHPAKLALITTCANLFRRGDLSPISTVLAGTRGEQVPGALALQHRIGIDPTLEEPASCTEPEAKRLATPDGAVVWDARDSARAFVSVNAPASRGVWGMIAGQEFDLGGMRIAVGEVERDYAVIFITSLDGEPLERSGRMLLAAVGSAENLGMGWNVDRTSVSNKWGRGPTQVNVIPADLTLGCRIKVVHALDGCGKRCGEVPVSRTADGSRFTIGGEHKTLWYEIVTE